MHSRDVFEYSDKLDYYSKKLKTNIDFLENGVITIDVFKIVQDDVLIDSSTTIIKSMNDMWLSGSKKTPIFTLRPIVLSNLNNLSNKESSKAINARNALIEFDDMVERYNKPSGFISRILNFWRK